MFKDKFNEIGLSATDTTVIINLNSIVGMAMGIVIGPMLKILGYRKVICDKILCLKHCCAIDKLFYFRCQLLVVQYLL